MPEKIVYQFDDFELDTETFQLSYKGTAVRLPQKAFDLLLALVSRHGEIVEKSNLIELVWGVPKVNDSVVRKSVVNTFNVTLSRVRRALRKSAPNRKFIVTDSGGYRFAGEVIELSPAPQTPFEEVTKDESTEPEDLLTSVESVRDSEANDTKETTFPGQPERPLVDSPSEYDDRTATSVYGHVALKHWPHIIIASTLYGLLYAIALVLEVAFQFDRLGRSALAIAPAVFLWMTISSIVGFAIDRKLTVAGKPGGSTIIVTIFFGSSALLFGALSLFLPSTPVTQSTLQAYPAHAAYLKDMSHFLLLAFIFLILPFHFVVTAESERRQERFAEVSALISGNRFAWGFRNAIYPRFTFLVFFLSLMAIASLIMTSRLLDHLKPAAYLNLFTQLVYFRVIVYFSLGVECLIWYYQALRKLQLIAQARWSPNPAT